MKSWVLLVAGAAVCSVACASIPMEVIHGKTDCYEVNALDASLGEDTFSVSGFQVVANVNCPKIKSVLIKVFDDVDGDGVHDVDEQLFDQIYALSNPPSGTLTTGAMSGGKSTKNGGTAWSTTLVNSDGKQTSFGGYF
ncbi:MAG: hypothetical protein ACI8QC_004104 [Planctomycetota bacterium]|jgi:hypothetical protein